MSPETDSRPKETIAVVGGGLSGLASALTLARSGRFEVTLFEKAPHLGGLCAPATIDGTTVDRFYHVVLPTDRATIAFLDDLGLSGEIEWRPSRAGFFGRDRIVPFASAFDFIRFPFLSPWAKLRLGWGILRTAHSASPGGTDEPAAREWLTRRFGRAVTAKFWDPLLRSKLGEAADRTPASFMDATIKRLFGARDKTGGRERMGGIRGGFAPVLRAAGRALQNAGVEIRLGTPIQSIRPSADGLVLQTAEGLRTFNRALLTVPLPEALKIVPADPGDPAWERHRRVEYMGIICVLAALRRSLSPYYLINLLDPELPFTGVIESTNVLGAENFQGRHLVYLPKYVTADDGLCRRTDYEIADRFIRGLRRMFPDLASSDILDVQTYREPYAQPLPLFGPALGENGFQSPLPGVLWAGTAFIRDSTANNDAALRTAAGAVEEILKA